MKKLLNRIQIILFILVISSVSIFWISKNRDFPEISLIEGRELSLFPRLGFQEFKITAWLIKEGRFKDAQQYFWNQFSTYTFQNQLILTTSDQFPQRIPLIRLARTWDQAMIKLTYLFLPDSAIPIDAKSKIYIMRDHETTLKGLSKFDANKIKLLDSRIEGYQELVDQFPDKNFFIFYFDTLASSKYDPRIPYFENLDGSQSIAYLEKNLPEEISLGKMEVNGIEDQNQYFFHTDHHWNIRGAWKAYTLIYDMLKKENPEISPRINSIVFKTYPDLKFLGTFARDTLYPFEPELFEIGIVDLPPYQVFLRDTVINYNQSEEYNQGNFEKNPYISHYERYYGKNFPLLEYSFDNNSSRNLLMFGTSFKLPLQPWIASHYRNSYFVDLRLYEDFSLSNFLEEHKVDDIIILTDNENLIGDTFEINP